MNILEAILLFVIMVSLALLVFVGGPALGVWLSKVFMGTADRW